MRKKVLGLLLVICLIAGLLLPALPQAKAAGAALATNYKLITPGYGSRTLKNYDEPVYMKTVLKETGGQYSKKSAETVIKGPYYAVEAGTENDWNAKLIWNTGDTGPTLYLNGFKLDDYWEDAPEGASKWRYRPDTDILMYSLTFGASATAPLTIILQGEDSVVHTRFGIRYANDLTIKSEGNTKLVLNATYTGIASLNPEPATGANTNVPGAKLTLDANLDITVSAVYQGEHSKAAVFTQDAPLTINGGTINVHVNSTSANICGIYAYGTNGDLTINGGTITADSSIAYSAKNATLGAGGKLTINGGTITTDTNSNGIYAEAGVDIKGGNITLKNGTTGVASAGDINITGGTLEMKVGGKAFAGIDADGKQVAKAPVLAAGITGYAGPNIYNLEAYGEESYKSQYIKISDQPIEKPTLPPAAPGGELPSKATIKFGTSSFQLTHYDTPVYTINKATDTTDVKGNAFTRYTQTSTGANADNWNAMFVWKYTDETPTLYLRGFKMDDWNETAAEADPETSVYQFLAVNPNNSKGYYQTYSIVTDKNVPLTIILTGEDSLLDCQFGITYHSNLTIKSEGNAKLTIRGISSGITPNETAGSTLTLDANLLISVRAFYNTQFAAGCIMSYQGDIIINGGTITCKALDTNKKNVNAICARSSGNITINGGTITGNNTVGQSHANGVIQTKDKLTINGGTVKVQPNSAVGLYGGKGIEINGGTINVTSPWYAITTGTTKEPAPIVINGGTLTVMAERCFYGSHATSIKIGEGVMAYSGSSKKNAEVFDGTTKLAAQPWWFSTNDKDQFLELDDTTDPSIPIFTVPSTPTDSTPATTPSTPNGSTPATTPSTPNGNNATTPGGNTPNETTPTGGSADSDSDSGGGLVLWIVFGVIIAGGAAAVVFIVLKRKKA